MKIKKILLIPPLNYPVPAVQGGAVEQLITFLLEQNEKYKLTKFIVISKYNKRAKKIKYKHSKVYFYTEQICFSSLYFNFRWFLYRIFCKVSCNSIAKKFFHYGHDPLSKYQYFCSFVAKSEKVEGISIEGQWELPFAHLNHLKTNPKIFVHLHASRKEDVSVRTVFPNSILLSEQLKSIWIKHNIPGENIILKNCANTEAFGATFNEKDKLLFKTELGINSNEMVLLYCGRITIGKGILQLLGAVNDLRIPFKLLLIGSANFGVSCNDDFETTIKEIIKNDKRIIPLGFIDNSKLPFYFSLADVFIFPSIHPEGAPLVTIEAMAAGLPIIATNSGGTAEYITNDTAYILPIDDNLTKNITNSITELYYNRAKRKSMSKAGRERAQQFSKENYYRNFVKIFSDKD